MAALALAAPASSDAGLRLFQIVGDSYEPDLRGGSYLMVAPTDRFQYDAEYLLDFGDGECARRVSPHPSGYTVSYPNPRYSRCLLTREEFQRAVTAIVVAEIKVKNDRLIRHVTQTAQRVAA